MKRKTISGKDLYFVAVKLFLRRGGDLLVLKDNFGVWDLPGGRIKPNEFNTPLAGILKRKVREELGGAVRYGLGKPVVFMRHERLENGKVPIRIFAVGYEGKYLSGKIKLSPRHPLQSWVHVEGFKPEEYFKGGWLKGVREYISIKK